MPWKKHKVDVVLECTGVFVKAGSEKHLAAGAKQVIISAPAKNKKLKLLSMEEICKILRKVKTQK